MTGVMSDLWNVKKPKSVCLGAVDDQHCQNEPIEGKVFCARCLIENNKPREERWAS